MFNGINLKCAIGSYDLPTLRTLYQMDESYCKDLAVHGLLQKTKSLSIPEKTQQTLTQGSTTSQVDMIFKYLEA